MTTASRFATTRLSAPRSAAASRRIERPNQTPRCRSSARLEETSPPELVDVAQSSDMASLGWNVDPKDWTTPGAPAIETAVVDVVQPGSIVVLHDEGPNRDGTVDTLGGIIDALQAEGYQFVTPAS
jgi:peptidoglycan/xylan/chitin deacetylase (PgdA/CDA1 family)